MSNRLAYVTCGTFAATLLILATRSASAGGQSVGLVRLQSTSPGTQQTGHVNISGKVIAGSVNATSPAGPAIKASSSSGTGILATSNATNGFAIEGDVTSGDGLGVLGNQLATGVAGALAYSNMGVYGTDAGINSNLAATFDGRVNVVGQRGSVIAGNVFGFSQVMSSAPVSVYMSQPALNTMGFFTGGAERIRINAAGVGIGTTSPGYTLHVLSDMVGSPGTELEFAL